MRRFFITFIAISLCFGALVGCKDNGSDEPVNPKPATIELLSKLVTAEAEGGEFKVGYIITNPDGSSLEGRSSEEWCHTFSFEQEGVMSFVVEPNSNKESRIASVYIGYGDVEAKFTLTQAGKGENLEEIATMDFDIRCDVNGPKVEITVTPEFDYVRYYFAYSKKSDIEAIAPSELQARIKATVEKFLAGEVNAMVTYMGYTTSQALDEYTSKGTDSATMTVNARTDYVAWACAIGEDVKVISDVVFQEFRTGDVEPSGNLIDVTIDEVNCDRVRYSVSTTNDDQYAVYVLPAAEADALNDEEIVALFNTHEDVTIYLQFGDYTGTNIGLSEQTDYYVITYGYSWGMATTEIQRIPFRTVAYEGGTPEFTIEVGKVTNLSFSGKVTCSPATVLYYTDYCDASTTAEEILYDLNYTIDWYVEDAGYYPDRISLMRVMGTRGESEFNYFNEYIYPSTDYKVYAIGIDEQTGYWSTDVVFSDIITTRDVQNVKISSNYYHYFDALEVATAYPESEYDPEMVSGYAVLPLMIEKDSNVADFYIDIFLGDISDTSYPTDEELFTALYTNGQHNVSPLFALCDFDTTLTICSVAIDKDGNRGAVQRTVIELPYGSRSNVTSFEQYLDEVEATQCLTPQRYASHPATKKQVID